jgi:3-phosphoglycerate kinase
MGFLRLTDLTLAGKRVFIRADLNVPRTTPATSRKTRASALRSPASSMR